MFAPPPPPTSAPIAAVSAEISSADPKSMQYIAP
jgi:hypothetical protein